MDYFKFKVQTTAENTAILIAFFGELPFDTFEENEQGFDAYMPVNRYQNETEEYLNNLMNRFEFSYQKELIKSQNWNQVWEANFEPIIVGDFCGVRADFHKPIKGVRHEILINPKMAFGTGHHETTFMVMEMMESLNFAGKKILDYGCGTGILAILASKLGAAEIHAVDIEIQSYENTLENARVNNVSNLQTRHGTLENVSDQEFAIILANINRNVILNSLEALYKKLSENGKLIVSGILKKDEQLLMEKAITHGFTVKKTKQKNNWICILFEVGSR